MTLVRQWSWEHTWATFSLLGMFVFNWIITFLLVPNIFRRVFRVSCERPRCAGPFWAGLGSGCCPVRPGDGTARHGPGISNHHGTYRQPGRVDSAPAVLPAESFSRAKACFCSPEWRWSSLVSRCAPLPEPAARHLKANPPQHGQTLSKSAMAIAIFAGILSCLPQRGHGIRGKRDPGCRVAGSVPGCFRKYPYGLFCLPWGASLTSHIACT